MSTAAVVAAAAAVVVKACLPHKVDGVFQGGRDHCSPVCDLLTGGSRVRKHNR